MSLYFPRSKPPTSCKRSWCQLSSPRPDGLPWGTYLLVSRGRCMWHLLWSEAIFFFRSFANTRFIFIPLTHFSMWMSLPQSLVRTCAASVRIRLQVGNFQLLGNSFTLSTKTLVRWMKTEVPFNHVKARLRSFAFVRRETSFPPCSRLPAIEWWPPTGKRILPRELKRGWWARKARRVQKRNPRTGYCLRRDLQRR